MDKMQKQLELAKEAVSLIKEYRKECEVLGEDKQFKSVRASKNGDKIIINHVYEDKLEYDLVEVSEVFRAELRGIGPCSSAFYEVVDLMKSEAEDEYRIRNKKDFINYIGQLYYTEYRCEEIYARLQEIESEAKELL